MKKFLLLFIILILACFIILNFTNKRGDVFISDYTVSDDGSKLNIKVTVASSMGYVRTMKVREKDNQKYITFYSTFGLNSKIGAKNEFLIDIEECSEIYIYRGNNEYKLALKKNSESNIWERSVDSK